MLYSIHPSCQLTELMTAIAVISMLHMSLIFYLLTNYCMGSSILELNWLVH